MGRTAVGAAVLAGALMAATLDTVAEPIRWQSRDELLAWMTGYRDDPQPRAVPAAVQEMARLGVFRDADRAGVYLGFYAGVLGANQLKAAELIARTFPLDPEDQVVIVTGIADSGLPEWRTLLGQFSERMPARAPLIRAYEEGRRVPLPAIPLDASPSILDRWWGQYFATGRYEAILPIISALAWAQEPSDLERLTIGGMAKWTLASNATRDKSLLDFLRSEGARRPKRIAQELAEVVAAAELFEVDPIRKSVVERLETLRAKGPPRSRGWAWWSEIGGTALAVGCVVAGASGAGAIIGIPCLVGGALSNATTRFLTLEERRQ